MTTIWIEGITLGLSTGLFCLTSCAMVFIPLLLSQKDGIIAGVRVVVEFTLGRLAAYIAFGAAAGFVGLNLESTFSKKLLGLAMILLSGLLMLYIINQIPVKLKFCQRLVGRSIKVPFWLGFITGINVCPPFLMAVSRAVDLGSVTKGIELFCGFFLGTSVYLIVPLPLGFLGKWENVRIVAYMTAVLSSIFLLVVGVLRLVN